MNLVDGDSGWIYLIKRRNRCWGNDAWGSAVGDYHGHPPGLTASDPVWQKYGIFGTYEEGVAKRAMAALAKEYPETDFRIVKVRVLVISEAVGEPMLGSGKTPPTTSSYPNDEHYEHVRRAITVSGGKPPDYVVEGSRRWRKENQ